MGNYRLLSCHLFQMKTSASTVPATSSPTVPTPWAASPALAFRATTATASAAKVSHYHSISAPFINHHQMIPFRPAAARFTVTSSAREMKTSERILWRHITWHIIFNIAVTTFLTAARYVVSAQECFAFSDCSLNPTAGCYPYWDIWDLADE